MEGWHVVCCVASNGGVPKAGRSECGHDNRDVMGGTTMYGLHRASKNICETKRKTLYQPSSSLSYSANSMKSTFQRKIPGAPQGGQCW